MSNNNQTNKTSNDERRSLNESGSRKTPTPTTTLTTKRPPNGR